MSTVNLFGPVNHLGMGVHFVNWAAALVPMLESKGHKVFVKPKGGVNLKREVFNQPLETLIPRMDVSLFDPEGLSISLWHMSDVTDFAGKTRVIYSVFETTGLTKAELDGASKVHAVWIPTKWHQERLNDLGISSAVVPEGIDPAIFFPGDTGLAWCPSQDPDEVRFLSVGKLEKRKGMEVLVDAMVMAAESTKRPIRVICHWSNPFMPDWTTQTSRLLTSRGFKPSGHLEGSVPGQSYLYRDTVTFDIVQAGFESHAEMTRLYRAAHFGVFPHYAEGWGLPLHESMACGLPPICQNYSGPTEYLRPGSFLPLEGSSIVAKDRHFFHGDRGNWSQVSTQSLLTQIMVATEYSESARLSISKAAAEAAGAYTWERSAKEALPLIEKLIS